MEVIEVALFSVFSAQNTSTIDLFTAHKFSISMQFFLFCVICICIVLYILDTHLIFLLLNIKCVSLNKHVWHQMKIRILFLNSTKVFLVGIRIYMHLLIYMCSMDIWTNVAGWFCPLHNILGQPTINVHVMRAERGA